MRTARICSLVASLALFSAACATKDGAEEAPTAPKVIAISDAGAPVAAEPTAITTAPATGTHLDGAGTGYQPRGYQPREQKGKTIELVLRSTPPGATASIDGKAIGVTPTFWSGKADQRSHEFTFVKDGHTMARYRFVATHSGVVHGSLSPLLITTEEEEKAPVEDAQ